jgi:uncharacterized protein YegJ (DUF2314 family)
MLKIPIHFSLICLTILLSGCTEQKKSTIEREGKADYIKDFSKDRMQLAIKEAQSSMGTFLEALDYLKPNTSGFSIRKGFTFGDSPKNIEFVWIGDVRRVGEDFEGVINNAPVDATYLTKGQMVRVSQDEVADWMYVENNELRGGYTLVALIYGSPKREQYESSLNFNIDWARYDFINPRPSK